MNILRKPATVLLLILILMLLLALACQSPPVTQADLATHTAVVKATEVAFEQEETENKAVMENPDNKIVFSYSGENQSYHTGLRNRTVFYIDYDLEKVLADESASFEEPAGCNTAKGTDTVSFDGFIVDEVEIMGDLTIKTDFVASGCPGTTNSTTVKYVMTGQLWAEFIDGQWTGTVTGSASLTQTWSDGEGPEVNGTYPIEWTIVGTPVE